MPFDRLVETVDKWAGIQRRNDVFAQIGPSEYRPSKIEWTRLLKPDAFRQQYEAAKIIIAHAGTGSIITALQLGKPIVIMPRRASLRETRSDHQVETAQQFSRYPSVAVAWDEKELMHRLEHMNALSGRKSIGPDASRELLEAVRGFILDDDTEVTSLA
jgi:UDP-N-acetylglucosamine transferase subunit ALG13